MRLLLQRVLKRARRLSQGKDKEKLIRTIDRLLWTELSSMVKSLPSLDKLSPVQRDLLETEMSIDELKRSLGRISSLSSVLAAIRDDMLVKYKRGTFSLREYLGRLGDVLDSIEKDVKRVKRAKTILNMRFPLSPYRYTIVIAGLPNAGKSSLLKALTGAPARIERYPFTTKKLFVGVLGGIQLVDTPGILDRPLERMKKEEKLAIIALKHLADEILFVWDPLQDERMQKNLLNSLKKLLNKPILLVVNKADLIGDEVPVKAPFVVSSLTGEGIDRLKEHLRRGEHDRSKTRRDS